jgi:sulfhydrogenase subunit delta
LTSLLIGRKPNVPNYSLCMECKRRGVPCVMVSGGQPCLGPITQAGCGALCPGCGRACYGCFGPMEQPNIKALGVRLTAQLKCSNRDMVRMLRNFNGYLEPFKQASDYYEQLEQA